MMKMEMKMMKGIPSPSSLTCLDCRAILVDLLALPMVLVVCVQKKTWAQSRLLEVMTVTKISMVASLLKR